MKSPIFKMYNTLKSNKEGKAKWPTWIYNTFRSNKENKDQLPSQILQKDIRAAKISLYSSLKVQRT